MKILRFGLRAGASLRTALHKKPRVNTGYTATVLRPVTTTRLLVETPVP